MDQSTPPVVSPREGPPSHPRMSPAGCAIIGLLLLVVFTVVAVAVSSFVMYRSTQDQAAQREKNLAWRLSRGQEIPPTVRDTIAELGAGSTDSFKEELQAWLTDSSEAEQSEDYRLPVNFPRFLQAIRESREERLSAVERMMLRLAIDADDVYPPYISEDNLLLHVEWIEPEREARAFVVADNPLLGVRTIFSLWLIKSENRWQLYDWKDLLEPICDSDFYATWYGLEDGGSYSRFYEAIQELSDASLTPEEHARKIQSLLLTFSIEKPYEQYARIIAANELLDMGAWEALEKVAKTLDPAESAYHWYFLAIAKMRLGDVQEGIRSYRKLIDQFGWFPGLPQLLTEWPDLEPEDSRWLEDLLIAELCTQPYIYSLNRFVSNRDEAFFERLAYAILSRADPETILARWIVYDVGTHPLALETMHRVFESQTEDAESVDRQRALRLSKWVAAYRAYEQDQWNEAAEGLLDLWQFSKDNRTDAYWSYRLDRIVGETLLGSGRHNEWMESAESKAQLASLMLMQLIENVPMESDDLAKLESILKAATSERLELSHPMLPAVSQAILQQEKEPEAAIQKLMALHAGFQDKLVDDEYEGPLSLRSISGLEDFQESTIFRAVYLTLSELSRQPAHWEAIRDRLNSDDLSFLIRTKGFKLPCDLDMLRETIQWYADSSSDSEDPWLQYYDSFQLFAGGQWQEADQRLTQLSMRSVAEEIDWSGTFAEAAELLPSLEDFDPFYSDNWLSLRCQMAWRCGRFSELFEKMIAEAVESESSKPSSQIDASSLSSEIQQRSEFAILFRQVPRWGLASLSPDSIQSQLPEQDVMALRELYMLSSRRHRELGDWDAAWLDCDRWYALASEDSDLIGINDWFHALQVGIRSGQISQWESIVESLTDPLAPSLRLAISVAGGDEPGLEAQLAAIDRKQVSAWNWYHDWPIWLGRNGRLGAMELLADHGVMTSGYRYRTTSNAVFFSSTEVQPESLVSALEERLLRDYEQTQRVPHETILGARAAWRCITEEAAVAVVLVKVDEGQFIFTGQDCTPEPEWLAFVIASDENVSAYRPLSIAAWKISQTLGAAAAPSLGVWTYETDAFHTVDDWLNHEPDNVFLGINSEAPIQRYLSWQAKSKQTLDGKEQAEISAEQAETLADPSEILTDQPVSWKIFIPGGIEEAVHCRAIEFDARSDAWKIEILEDSLLDSALKAGDIILVSSDRLMPR